MSCYCYGCRRGDACNSTAESLGWLNKDNSRAIARNARETENLAEIERLRQALERIQDLCGPPKMSETMATAFSRIKRIKALAEEALDKDGKG
jgi:hypothetical protein